MISNDLRPYKIIHYTRRQARGRERAGAVADSRGHKNWHICSQIGLAGLVSCLLSLVSSLPLTFILYLFLLLLFLLKNSNSAQCRFVSGQLAKWRVINTLGLLNLKQSDNCAESSFMATLLPSLYLRTNRQIHWVLQHSTRRFSRVSSAFVSKLAVYRFPHKRIAAAKETGNRNRLTCLQLCFLSRKVFSMISTDIVFYSYVYN